MEWAQQNDGNTSAVAELLAQLSHLTQLKTTAAELTALPQLCRAIHAALQGSAAGNPNGRSSQSVKHQANESHTPEPMAHATASAIDTHTGVPADAASHTRSEDLDWTDTVVSLLLGVLFQQGSKPLHKQLLSALQPHLAEQPLQPRMERVLHQLLSEASTDARVKAAERSTAAAPFVATAQAWVSLLQFAPARDALASCASFGLETLAGQVHAVLAQLQAGLHLSAALTLELQV